MKDLLSNQRIEPRDKLPKPARLPTRRPAGRLRALRGRIVLFASLTGFLTTAICLGMAIFLPTPSVAQTAQQPGRQSETGSGYIQPIRDTDIGHVVAEGESLSEIAYLYGIDASLLARYNKIAAVGPLAPGQKLTIPSRLNEQKLSKVAESTGSLNVPVSSSASHSGLRIRADRQFDGNAVTAHFSVEQPSDKTFSEYQWDLGNGKQAFRPNTYWSYETPGTYAVKLRVRDQKGRSLSSNVLYIDVPHPASFRDGRQHFITLNGTQDSFRIDGVVKSVRGYDSLAASPLSKVGEDGAFVVYQANKPGYYALNVESGGQESTLYLFVSPVRSVHADRSDINWYRTQFNTGTLSNCGPSTVSMAYAWARGDYLPVSAVRQSVGWHGDGSTSMEELDRVLKADGIETRYVPARSPKDLFQIIDRQNIAIALVSAGGIAGPAGQDRNLFGRYYTYLGGHYIVLKGYSEDRRWIIAYDPIPSDWSSNSFRQADGISMIGRNRYYAVEDVLASLRRAEVLEISR